MTSKSDKAIVLRVARSLAAFAALHTLLAYRGTKQVVENTIGEKPYRKYYRIFYNAQAVVSTAALFRYILKQPDKDLYEIQSPPLRLLMRGGQALAAAYCTWAMLDFGFARFFGWTDYVAASHGSFSPAQAMAPRESQGPTADENGKLITTGAFQVTRHPLNLSAFVFFWLLPKMTRNSFICGLLGSAYLIFGSVHEETRLREQFGRQYEEYQKSGVPFFFPRFWPHRK